MMAPQIAANFLPQSLMSFGSVGMSFLRTSENVCGPTFAGSVELIGTTIDAGAVANGIANEAQPVLGVRAILGAGVEGRLPAGDLAVLDSVLADPGADFPVRGSRTAWAARRPLVTGGSR